MIYIHLLTSVGFGLIEYDSKMFYITKFYDILDIFSLSSTEDGQKVINLNLQVIRIAK
jgi:hypothetical protein